jgi:hypothetical protein
MNKFKMMIALMMCLMTMLSFGQVDTTKLFNDTIIKITGDTILDIRITKNTRTIFYYIDKKSPTITKTLHFKQVEYHTFKDSYYYNGENINVKETFINSDTVKYENQTEQYCQVIGTCSNIFCTKLVIQVDYGNFGSKLRERNGLVIGEDGKVEKFTSMIDALNYMNNEGWIFVNAYVITVNNQNVYHYVLKRKI